MPENRPFQVGDRFRIKWELMQDPWGWRTLQSAYYNEAWFSRYDTFVVQSLRFPRWGQTEEEMARYGQYQVVTGGSYKYGVWVHGVERVE